MVFDMTQHAAQLILNLIMTGGTAELRIAWQSLKGTSPRKLVSLDWMLLT